MKINNVFLTLILCISSFSVWGQSDNLNVVRNHYPEIYTSIQQSIGQQWDDPQVKQTVLEGQAKAFLALAESQNPMDSGVLAEAILNNSLPNMKEYNTRILNDLSIENPFPLLKCDWFKVKAYYDRRVSSQYTAAASSTPARTVTRDYTAQTQQRQQQAAQVTQDYAVPQVQQRDAYDQPRYTQQEPDMYAQEEPETPVYTPYTPPVRDSRDRQYDRSRDSYFDEYGYDDQRSPSYTRQRDTKKESPFHIGIKLGGGLGSFYNMGSYLNRVAADGIPANLQLKSKLGLQAEGGLAFMYKSGGFFVQNETGVQYSQAKFSSKQYDNKGGVVAKSEKDFDNTYLYLQTAFHFGGYYEIDKGVHLIAGVGPYIGFNLNADYDEFGFFPTKTLAEGEVPTYEKYMKDGEKSIMFGVSGVFGVDINKFRIALYPSMGLTKMHDKEEYKPFGATLGFTYWFF